jgi:putative ABC transport system substrate-binding protein
LLFWQYSNRNTVCWTCTAGRFTDHRLKSESAEAGIIAAVRQGVKESGFVEGKNIDFVYRWSDGNYARLPEFAAELVKAKVDAIAASGLPAALAAKAATSTIPIVFRLAIDPVAFGLARSFDHPGENITGVTMLFDPLTPKKLQLLHELLPAETDWFPDQPEQSERIFSS